jgi:biopolymer transport protein ExbD
MSGGARNKKRVHKIKQTSFPSVRSDINVTPLVDVCLVLLIIFMVITPMMSRGREVQLPKTKNHYQRKDKLQPVVAMDREGIVWYEKEKLGLLSENGIPERLQDKITRGWEKVKDPESMNRVYVKAAADLTYAKVYPLLILINDMGVGSIDLGTNELEAK